MLSSLRAPVRRAFARTAIRRPVGWLLAQLLCLVATMTAVRARLAAQDDAGLSTPEKAALTVLGLGLAGVLAAAAYSYVNGKVGQFK
jgi:hypothetical protein